MVIDIIFVHYLAEQQGGYNSQTLTLREMIPVGERKGTDIILANLIVFSLISLIKYREHFRSSIKE